MSTRTTRDPPPAVAAVTHLGKVQPRHCTSSHSHTALGGGALVLEKVPSEFYPKVCNHGEGPY